MYLTTYDITSNKLRQKVAHQLLYFGLHRIQYSVFIGPLSITLLPRVIQWLKSIELNLDKDNSILIFPMTKEGIKRKVIFGDATYDWQELMGLKHTLYLD